MKIFIIDNKKENDFLRKPAAEFDFSQHSKKEIKELIKQMRETMQKAGGIGLSANQVGLDMKFFIAQVENKFYAVFNPRIVKKSSQEAVLEEGCLSVPNKLGLIKRANRIVLEGFNQNGKKIKIKAWGLLAQVFQHEVDHLNGILFTDKAQNVHEIKK